MPSYRRWLIPGGTYFVTGDLLNRRSDLLVREIDALRQAFRRVRTNRPFEIVAMAVLPDHLHCIWTLPPGDADYSIRWSQIKNLFSRTVRPGESRSLSRVSRNERGIWQRRFWEHVIRDEDDLANHVDYIHYNPVKHGHTASPGDWPHSSFHRFVRKGILDANWAVPLSVRVLDPG